MASPPAVAAETIEKATTALLKWQASKSKSEKPQLLNQDQDQFIYLILTLKKIPPKGRTNPHKIPLRHPLHSPPNSELCLIVDDRPNSHLTSQAAKTKVKSENIPVSKVLSLSKLKSNFRPFEAKRKLCDSYDFFLADKRIVPLLPKLLGKHFFKKRKIPVAVDLGHKNWKEQIDRACGSALLYLRTGTCSVVRVGKLSMEKEQIVENVVAAIDGVVELVPKKLAGVRSLHLKLLESLALPVYQAVPDMRLKIEGVLGKESEEVKEEEESGRVEKGEKKKVGKKGRIHEVRYMDGDVGGLLEEDEFDGDGDEDDGEGDKSADDELGGGEIVGKKRKKEKTKKEQVLSDLNGEKPLKKSKKVKKEDDEKQKKKKDRLNVKSGEKSGGNKKKDRVKK
ncbi:hypothetical protein PVL29_015012 [Vitis rotundifolia]|uniref:Ribosomal protein L1 n=1 Tax=Vitis rotundifolia TaxID=103349 RepID=A0AA38ZBG0_VITRO|nr:hypothetical protein PVL29_015012 [Vitis rotundifolia]